MGLFTHVIADAHSASTLWHDSDTRHYVARFILLVCGHYASTQLSRHFAIPPGFASPLWPPSAIALSACLLWGLRMAPAIWLSAMLANWSAGGTVLAAATIGAGVSIQACMVTLLIRRTLHGLPDFTHHESVLRFIGIVAACSTIAATIGTTTLAATHRLQSDQIALNWLTWWHGNVSGMIIGTPILLAQRVISDMRRKPAMITETGIFALLLLAVTQLAFGETGMGMPLAYLPIPFVLWAAFRFSPGVVGWTTGTICAVAVWNTAHGRGPFLFDNMNTALLLAMTYVSVIGTTGLVVAGLAHQRRQAEHSLRSERNELEHRVQCRTEELVADLEERKRIELQLATREKQLAEAQRLAQVGSWNWDLDSGRITWSDELYRIYGLQKERFDVTSAACRALIYEDDLPDLLNVVRSCKNSGEPFHIEHRIKLPFGPVKTVSARGYAEKDDSGHVARMFGTVQDITDAKRAEASLREAEERYRTLVEVSPDAILVLQDGVFVFANQAACELLHAHHTATINGKSLFDVVHPDFHEITRERMACLLHKQPLRATEDKFVTLDGAVVDVELNASPFLHQGKFASLLLVRDITERKKNLEQMVQLAHYDSLTGLPNRMLLRQRLEHALILAARPSHSLELLFLDLDRFKNINDTLGHATGDLVLKEAARRLQGILRESDTVARLGGDEFVVLVENVDEPHWGGIIAEKILSAFKPPFLQDKEQIGVGTSIGIASFPTDGTDADTLLKNADIAMYRAKEKGRNNYRYYSVEMNRHTTERLSLEFALGNAIDRDQLVLYYQPKVDLRSNQISGMEALLRWSHPTLGLLKPQKFIGIAEETGLIIPIGYWAIRAACRQNKLWQETGPARLKVAVNLSLSQLADDNLVANLRQILDDCELDARYLELEITEAVVMANPDKAIQVLHALHDAGISLALDDFGTGHSSLAHLKQFPIGAVKIDRSFVHGIPANHSDATITKAIIGLAHSLELGAIAEGTETQQQFEFLKEHDCDSVQGYYFSEPMSAEVFSDLLQMQPNLHLH